MIIKAMRYRELKTGSGYNHKAVELEAEIQDGEDFNDAFERLVHTVEAKIRETSISEIEAKREELAYDVQRLASDRARLGVEVDDLRVSVEKLRAEKKAAGGKPPEEEDLPF